jgi:hypothetical protein
VYWCSGWNASTSLANVRPQSLIRTYLATAFLLLAQHLPKPQQQQCPEEEKWDAAAAGREAHDGHEIETINEYFREKGFIFRQSGDYVIEPGKKKKTGESTSYFYPHWYPWLKPVKELDDYFDGGLKQNETNKCFRTNKQTNKCFRKFFYFSINVTGTFGHPVCPVTRV